jgi:hypothetical protein
MSREIYLFKMKMMNLTVIYNDGYGANVIAVNLVDIDKTMLLFLIGYIGLKGFIHPDVYFFVYILQLRN